MPSSIVHHFSIGDPKEGGRSPQSVAALLHRLAERIGGLGKGEVMDLVMETGSYYYVTQIDVYATARDESASSAVSHLIQGPGQQEQTVPELLRRTADTIAGLGEVDVQGLVMHSNDKIDGVGRGPWISIYYRATTA